MKKIEIKGKQIEIIEKLSETNISQFELIVFNYKKEFESEIDKFIQVLNAASNLSVDEIEEMDLDIFKDLIINLNINDLDENGVLPTQSFMHNGITYHPSKDISDIKLNVKEMKLLQASIKESKDFFIGILAAILYKEDGGNLTPESILPRKDILELNMTMDYIIPYLIKLKDLDGLKLN